MISTVVYLIDTIVIGYFCYKVYSIIYVKKTDNKFAYYFFWATLLVTLAYLKSVFLFPLIFLLNDLSLLFWVDFFGRALFYTSSLFSVQAPLYKFYPKSNKRVVFSYIFGLIGIGLLVYQFFNQNHPTINQVGIINFDSDIVLNVGMALLLLLPWAVSSLIFINEFIKSKFHSTKSLLMGIGFLLTSFGGISQDLSNNVILYILFSIPLMAGFMLILAGLNYEDN